MPTIPQRIARAFAVLCGRYGDVTRMAGDRDQSGQSLYREDEEVVEAVDGAARSARGGRALRRAWGVAARALDRAAAAVALNHVSGTSRR